jgi:hypothetical protein
MSFPRIGPARAELAPHSIISPVTADECPHSGVDGMKTLTHTTRGVSVLISLNMDRFLVPLLIVAALFLGGMIFGYATVH